MGKLPHSSTAQISMADSRGQLLLMITDRSDTHTGRNEPSTDLRQTQHSVVIYQLLGLSLTDSEVNDASGRASVCYDKMPLPPPLCFSWIMPIPRPLNLSATANPRTYGAKCSYSCSIVKT
ncbi:hypothetical protein EVAR_79401_1 [Eumeta japonica]|uniref:Uncharacterized protein n=1 Tax=Eumeta variegata TaxID=151549 RepID=A0A4C1VEA9_EUMVA|nr:hypothetical protein EVAR_79401_1 [Eumeta japonica]